jgi:hypothetical protein
MTYLLSSVSSMDVSLRSVTRETREYAGVELCDSLGEESGRGER